jgi:hypothetical protein
LPRPRDCSQRIHSPDKGAPWPGRSPLTAVAPSATPASIANVNLNFEFICVVLVFGGEFLPALQAAGAKCRRSVHVRHGLSSISGYRACRQHQCCQLFANEKFGTFSLYGQLKNKRGGLLIFASYCIRHQYVSVLPSWLRRTNLPAFELACGTLELAQTRAVPIVANRVTCWFS